MTLADKRAQGDSVHPGTPAVKTIHPDRRRRTRRAQRVVRRAPRRRGIRWTPVDSGEACIDRLRRVPYDLVLLDVLAARRRRTRDALPHPRAADRRPGGHDLGPRQTSSRRSAPSSSVAFDFIEKPLSLDKTMLVRAQRAAPAAARGREPRAAGPRRQAPPDGRGELCHAAAARAGGDGGRRRNGRVLIYGKQRDRQGNSSPGRSMP